MTRKECLDAAAGCVLKDRNRDYGGPEDSFGVIANFWSVYLGVAVDRVDVAMMMGMLKMARIRGNKNYADGFVDLAGYAACAAECAGAGIKPKADEEPKFKHGDRVQFSDEIPSTSEPCWFDGVYVERLPDGGHAVSFGPNGHVIHCSDKDIRPAPKAEGCEELVQKDLHEDCEGCLYKTFADSHAEEHDAPQTKEELMERIKDINPAVYGAHLE